MLNYVISRNKNTSFLHNIQLISFGIKARYGIVTMAIKLNNEKTIAFMQFGEKALCTKLLPHRMLLTLSILEILRR